MEKAGATPPWQNGPKTTTAPERRKPPDIPSSSHSAAVIVPLPRPVSATAAIPKLPVLPTTPIPVSELPPAAVRSPPAKMVAGGGGGGGSPMIPGLSNLTPIPLRELQQQQQQSTAMAAAAAANKRVMVVQKQLTSVATSSATVGQQQQLQPVVTAAVGQQQQLQPVVTAAAAATEFVSIQVNFHDLKVFQVSRAFGIPQKKKHLYFISVSGAFLGTSLPPTPNWSRFDLFIDVYSILFYCISSYTLYLIIVFLHVVR
jgi:hypothetical protein